MKVRGETLEIPYCGGSSEDLISVSVYMFCVCEVYAVEAVEMQQVRELNFAGQLGAVTTSCQ